MAGDILGSSAQEPPTRSPSPPRIKVEPGNGTFGPQGMPRDVIDLISDDDDDDKGDAPSNAGQPRLGSPFQPRIDNQTSHAPNLGASMLSKPKPMETEPFEANFGFLRDRILALKQKSAKETAQQFREPQQDQRQTPVPRRSGLFVTESDPGTPDPAQEFRALQTEIEDKRRTGTLTWVDEIRFGKAEAAEQSRVSKQRSDQQYDLLQRSPLESEGIRETAEIANYSDVEDEERGKAGSRKRASQPKRRGTKSDTMDMDDILEEARRKNASKVDKGKGKAKGKAKSKPKTQEKQAPKAKATKGRNKRPAAPNLTNLASLQGSNVFKDFAQNEDLRSQPTFDPSSRRDKALKNLLASLPDDCRHIGKADKKYLDDAMKDFTGQGVVKPAADSKWSVKGMKITLKNYQILGVAAMKRLEATRTQVQQSYPSLKHGIPAEFTTADQKKDFWAKHYQTNRGTLHRIKWHRIVLDEAQAIKNHRSLTSLACRALDGKHHWAISGTPVLNNISEFYSLFKFIGEPHTGSLKIFKENFCDPNDPDGLTKLGSFLNKFMIRRTHLDKLFNARLVDLPKPKEDVIWLEFNEVERSVYEIVKSRFVERINCISAANQLDKQYGHIFSMLTCLRQLTSHILLAQGAITNLLERDDFERLMRISGEDLLDEKGALLTHLRAKLKEISESKHADDREGATIITETEMMPTDRCDFDGATQHSGGTHGLNYRFDRYLDNLLNSESWESITARTLCSGCRQPPSDPHVTSCFHIYCHTCLRDLQASSARLGKERHRCACGAYYSEANRCQKSLDRFSSVHGSIDGEGLNLTGKSKKPKHQSWITMNGEVLPSAKTIAFKAQIMNWLEEEPDVKIIVYSLWLPFIHVLGRVCQTEGWNFEKYTGAMTHDSREKAIRNFGDPEKKVQILLASLKCGGLGLNLTMASRVLNLDPYWNRAIEQQAFCRVFRIGQEKETRLLRMCVKGTVDAAIYHLQASKQEQIDEAMDESKRKGNFNINDLMRLFGNVGHDGGSKPFIFAHEPDNHEDDADSDAMHSPPRPAADRESDQEIDVHMDDE